MSNVEMLTTPQTSDSEFDQMAFKVYSTSGFWIYEPRVAPMIIKDILDTPTEMRSRAEVIDKLDINYLIDEKKLTRKQAEALATRVAGPVTVVDIFYKLKPLWIVIANSARFTDQDKYSPKVFIIQRGPEYKQGQNVTQSPHKSID